MAKKVKDLFLENNHLHITYLKQKKNDNKLVLCLGAGFCIDLGMPSWEELVNKIANRNEVNSSSVMEIEKLSLTTKIQVLFEIYRKNYIDLHKDNSLFIEDEIRNNWINIVRECLYEKYKHNEEEHKYFKEYIEIIKNSPVTVNYNFDDVIERYLRESDNGIINYVTTSRPSMQFKRDDSVIYHPNGFIPNEDKSFEGNFVFSEKSFQDQLIDTMSGQYNPLQYLFLNYTMLLTGFSLDDPTMRHMLRKNATLNPGHFHYYIYYINPEDKDSNPSLIDREAIRESYFETFNLVTLFLSGDEIKKLARYITLSEKDYYDILTKCGLFRSFIFYISGCPGSGKTSSLNQLADFVIQDEFPKSSKGELYQQDSNLTPEEREALDEWITEQFCLRNRHIIDKANASCCIQLIDRSPIDPLCFINENDTAALQKRAKELKSSYNDDNKIVDGKVIVLEADSDEIFLRLNKRNPIPKETNKYNYTKEYIKNTINDFENLFPNIKYKHIITTGKSKSVVVKEIAHEIFFGKYEKTGFMGILDERINSNYEKCS